METIFSKIIKKEIPADVVYETEEILAFKDVHPQAPVHILVIPKTPLINLQRADSSHQEILGKLLLACNLIAEQEGLGAEGYRVVINNGAAAGQSVFHLHLHILGGRPFSWPPG